MKDFETTKVDNSGPQSLALTTQTSSKNIYFQIDDSERLYT